MCYNTDILDIIRAKRPNIEMDEILIGSAINEIEQKIKNYCVRPSVPKALYYTWANMVLDLLDYENAVNNINTVNTDTNDDITNILTGNFGTIAMGDTSWKQGDVNITDPQYRGLSSHTAALDELILNYRSDLNQFRRIW